MNRKIALRWARALESGEYNQVQGLLRADDGFCCLGVLCNLHAQAHPDIAAEQTDPNKYMGEKASLPGPVMEWAGIRWSDAGRFEPGFKLMVDKDTDAVDLIELNDLHDYDFDMIAAVIRKHSDKL